MDRVLFYDVFGVEHIPNRLFEGLQEADEYANEHDFRVGRKIETIGEDIDDEKKENCNKI